MGSAIGGRGRHQPHGEASPGGPRAACQANRTGGLTITPHPPPRDHHFMGEGTPLCASTQPNAPKRAPPAREASISSVLISKTQTCAPRRPRTLKGVWGGSEDTAMSFKTSVAGQPRKGDPDKEASDVQLDTLGLLGGGTVSPTGEGPPRAAFLCSRAVQVALAPPLPSPATTPRGA